MNRPLVVVPDEPLAVLDRLRAALGGGAALLVHPQSQSHPQPERLGALPDTVPQRVAVVIETSGSTAQPKRVMLSADALLASAAASDAALGGPGQWLLTVPTQYIAGINVLMRSITAATSPVVMAASGFTAERFIAAASELSDPQRFVSLVPAQLSRIIAVPDGVDALQKFTRVLVGGQALPSVLAERARQWGIPIVRSYGSSETSGGCVYDGLPIGDTRMRLNNGRLEISGRVLAEGYLDDPQRTAAAFYAEDGYRWYRTDDTGEIIDGVLRVTGRRDDVIVSGGVKVALSAVEDIVRALPGLDAAVVVAAPHPEWGEVPVVVTEIAVSLATVRDAVTEQIGRPAAPARILLLDRLPLLLSGKPDRRALAALVDADSPLTGNSSRSPLH